MEVKARGSEGKGRVRGSAGKAYMLALTEQEKGGLWPSRLGKL